jgi:pre-mRNA branch site protein p14
MALSEQMRLPPGVNRVLYVRNLPFKINNEELYEIFGRYGAIRQIRRGIAPDTKGSAYVVYEDIFDAKNAVDNLNGFNIGGKYLIVVYYQRDKMLKRIEVRRAKQELENLKKKLG